MTLLVGSRGFCPKVSTSLMSVRLTSSRRGFDQVGGGRAWHLEMASLNGARTASGRVSKTRLVMPELCMASTIPTGSLRCLKLSKNLWNIMVLGVMISHAVSSLAAQSSGLSFTARN